MHIFFKPASLIIPALKGQEWSIQFWDIILALKVSNGSQAMASSALLCGMLFVKCMVSKLSYLCMIDKDIIFTLQDCEWRVLATIKFNYEVIIPLLKRLLPMNVTLVIAIYSFEEYHLY